MNIYKLIYEIRSSVITPFQADTIFGHLCWAIKYLKGEESLLEFLKDYEKGEKPSLILSDGLPENFLPRPILRPLKIEESEELINNFFGKEKRDKVEGLSVLKKIKNPPFISWDIFKELEGTLSYFRLYQKVLDGSYCPVWFRKKLCKEKDIMRCFVINPVSSTKCHYGVIENKEDNLVVHNTINRLTGKVQEPGGLFAEIETYCDTNERQYEIYIKTDYFSTEDLKEFFCFIAESGYGKDKSIGKGHLELKKIEEFNLYEPPKGNGFMTLSSFIPKEKDPIKGYYEIITKYGKLGGDYAKTGIEGRGLNPFKKPLLMFKSGSTFFTNDKNMISYGRLLQNIHYNNTIRHYGYAFPLKIKLE